MIDFDVDVIVVLEFVLAWQLLSNFLEYNALGAVDKRITDSSPWY